MQRDMKIGMALGVALVGIVGALFFRREPEVKDKETPPPLQNAEELDREIAGRAKAPYIKGLEEFDNAAAPVPPPGGPASKPKDDDAKQRKPAAAPEPIQSSQPSKNEGLVKDQVPAHNEKWEPFGPSGTAGKKAGENPRTSPAGTNVGTNRMHVIQPGETLSGLASRYLGSSARYNEIYEANKNVLRSPNDVREGLSIVIPDANSNGADSNGARPRDAQHVADGAGTGQGTSGQSGTKAQKASTRTVKPDIGKPDLGKSDQGKSDTAKSEKDQSGAAADPVSDRPRDKIRFVPVPRGPFSAGRVSAQGTPAKSESRKAAAPIDESIEEN